MSQTRFGRRLKQRFHSSEIGGRIFYVGCELHDVPPAPDAPQPR